MVMARANDVPKKRGHPHSQRLNVSYPLDDPLPCGALAELRPAMPEIVEDSSMASHNGIWPSQIPGRATADFRGLDG